MKTSYLVAYEYGQGAIWAVILAESANQIERDFPEMTEVHERPTLMTDCELREVEIVRAYDLGDTAVAQHPPAADP